MKIRTNIISLISTAALISGCGGEGTVKPDEFLIRDIAHSTTQTEAVITWETNIPARCYVRYGLSQTALDSATQAPSNFTETHRDTLEHLFAGTAYYYRITAIAEDSEQAQSSLCSFQTVPKPNQEPILSGLTIDAVTTYSASISWYTDELADSWVFFDTTAANFNDSTGSAAFSIFHSIQLSDLIPSKTYYFRAVSSDSEGFAGQAPDSSFTTLNPVTLVYPDTTVSLGATIQYPVLIDDAVDLFGIQYYLKYDAALLTALSMTEGPFTQGSNHDFFIPVIDTTQGLVKNFIDWFPQDSAGISIGTNADGDGILAYVEFQAVAAGTSSITLPTDAALQDSIFIVFFDTPTQRSALLNLPGQIVVTNP